MESDWKDVQLVSFRDMCPEIPSSRYSTHALHSYPAQLLPQIPYYFLSKLKKGGNSLVLDPFCGTGTVMVEAMHNGWDSIGIEINPVAALISKVKTTPVGIVDLESGFDKIVESHKDMNNDVDTPHFENINYWFEKDAINELARIRSCLNCLENDDVRDFFTITFSSIVKGTSRADPRIYVPVLPKNGYSRERRDPWDLFRERSMKNINRMREFNKLAGKKDVSCKILNKDVLAWEGEDTVDLAITSPPYINAQKYVRSTRLEAYWLGYNKSRQLEINKNTIGTERVTSDFYSSFRKTGFRDLDAFIKGVFLKDKKRAGILSEYFFKMIRVIEKIHSVMKRNGILIKIIGNNTVMGKKIRTNEYISKICENVGFKIENVMADEIDSRGLMTKRNITADVIDYEWVIVMRKV